MVAGGSSDLNRLDLTLQGAKALGLATLDAFGRVLTWNAAAEAITGYAAAEALGECWARLFSAAGAPVEKSMTLKAAAERGLVTDSAWRASRDGGRYWAEAQVEALRGAEGQVSGFVLVFRDATGEVEAARQAEETREQRRLDDKMEAFGRLAGVAAHDFNNLLTAVLSRSELALRAVDNDTERLVRMIVGVRDAAQRGAAMTRQLMAFAGRQLLEPVRLDLAPRLSALAEKLKQALPPGVQLEVDVPEALAHVEADPQALEASLTAVALNARDAMPEGGRMTLSARNVSLCGEAGGLRGDFVQICLADTGSGIDPELQGRVFEPFFTTRSGGAGTGLGLAQAYGFARQSEGAVTLRSEPGQGTTVSLYLPVRVLSEAAVRSVADHAHEAVLVVEDDSQVAELTDQLFRELGYEPIMARTPREALEMLARAKVDLVFSDVVMPGGLSGFELARRIRTRFPEMPILLTTGFADSLAEREVGEFPVLTKPYRIDELVAALDKLQMSSAGPQAKPH